MSVGRGWGRFIHGAGLGIWDGTGVVVDGGATNNFSLLGLRTWLCLGGILD